MAVRTPARVHYPESDGQPIGETQAHYFCILLLVLMLRTRYADDPDVLVGGDQMMYWVEGDPRQVDSPDGYVFFGVPKEPLRRTLLLWQEGKPPTIVVEVTSRKTRREDLVTKRALYERLGIQEYILFDPLDEYLSPRLQGLTLTPAGYAPIQTNDAGRLPSATLGLELEGRGHLLALWDPRAGRYLPTPDEEAAARRAAEVARAREEMARRAAETARTAAEAARVREEAARTAAEAEVARLRAELERLKGTDR